MKISGFSLILAVFAFTLSSARVQAQSISDDNDLPPATKITDPIITPTPPAPAHVSTPAPTPEPETKNASAKVLGKLIPEAKATPTPLPSAATAVTPSATPAGTPAAELPMTPVDPTPTPGPQPLKETASPTPTPVPGTVPSNPSDITTTVSSSSVWTSNLQLGLAAAFQGGGSSVGPAFHYQPEYLLMGSTAYPRVGFGIDLGISSFSVQGDSTFAALEYGAFASVHASAAFDAKLLVGGESWTGGNGSAFMVGPEFVFHFLDASGSAGSLGIYVSYQAVFLAPTASVVGAGIQLQF